MFIKMTGSIVVITTATLIGFLYSREFSRRPQELRDLQACFQTLENEIGFVANPVIECFERITQNGNHSVNCFFEKAIKILKKEEGINTMLAWEKAVREEIKKTALNKEDEEILVSFGRLFGNSDIEGQINNIKLTMNHLKLQEIKAEEARKKNENMFKSLGILSGIAIVILLF